MEFVTAAGNDQFAIIVFHGLGGFVYRYVFFGAWAYDFNLN